MNFDFSYLDVAFKNGSVITVNETDEVAQAVGIKGNKIVFVGSNADIDQLLDSHTKVYDLAGRSLLPGFNDSHFHPILNGMLGPDMSCGMIDTTKKNCPSLEAMLQMIRKTASTLQPGRWISMMGYEPTLFPEGRHPTIEELDEAAPNHPVHCMHGGGHICMYNHKALEYLGVYGPEDAAKYPADEVEVVDGRLTGMVRGHTHFWLWGQVEYTEEQQRKAALKSQQQCFAAGITSVGDMGECDRPSYHTMQKLCRDREFRVRSYMALHSIFGKPYSLEDNDHWLKLGFLTGLGDEHFRVGPCKFMIDGGTGGPSCATREPYSHDPSLPRERGWEREETWDYIKKINDAGCQATAHAVGDLAVEFMVEGYERCFAENPEKVKRLRHRIEHCVIVDQDLIDRMARMNICSVLHPGLIQMLGKNLASFYGPERSRYLEAVRSMLDAGIKVSLHSDAPSGPVGIHVIDAAVNRYDRSKDYQFDQTQCVSVLDAIRCYTLHPAYASYQENIKGSIEVGKLADMIVLSDDILKIAPMDIHKLKVDMTMIDGIVEYER